MMAVRFTRIAMTPLECDRHALHLYEVNFTGNSAVAGVAGALYMMSGTNTVMNCLFDTNSGLQAGAIYGRYYDDPSRLIVQESTFQSCTATDGYGGAVWLNMGFTGTFHSTSFLNNRAKNVGGAMFLHAGSEAIFADGLSKFQGNQGGTVGSGNSQPGHSIYKHATTGGGAKLSFTKCKPGTFQGSPIAQNSWYDINEDFYGCRYSCQSSKTTGDEATLATSGKSCMAGTEHVDWMHLGDASGAADCLDRVLNSVSAKAEDADKRCDLESELYSFHVTAPVGRSCVCPIVGASQAAETTCSHNAPGTMNVYRASRGQAFASRMDNDQAQVVHRRLPPLATTAPARRAARCPCPRGRVQRRRRVELRLHGRRPVLLARTSIPTQRPRAARSTRARSANSPPGDHTVPAPGCQLSQNGDRKWFGRGDEYIFREFRCR